MAVVVLLRCAVVMACSICGVVDNIYDLQPNVYESARVRMQEAATG